MKREVAATWEMKKVVIIPIIISVLVVVLKESDTYIENIGVTLNIGHVQNKAILGKARI